MTIEVGSALKDAADRLDRAHVDAPRLDAELLLAHALGASREGLFLAPTRALDAGEVNAFEVLLERRVGREPVARILGTREFWSMEFTLNAATLVPRPDSETLVQAASAEFAHRQDEPLRILDLGTGSGCLLLALLNELPAATGVGLDCDENAVEAARQNAQRLGLDGRAEFSQSDWFGALQAGEGRFDVIISNPPYIESGAIAGLAPEVAMFEPRAALDGGADGLRAYRAIAAGASDNLAPGGMLLMEIGAGKDRAVTRILQDCGFTILKFYDDLGGVPRVVSAALAPESGS